MMKVLSAMLLSTILIAFGYVYTCYYFSDKQINSIKSEKLDKAILKLNRNRILYLVFSVLVVMILVYLFQSVYSLGLIDQLKLLSLVLIMEPMAAIDHKVQKIPNQLLIVGLVVRIIILVVEFSVSFNSGLTMLMEDIIGALIIGLFFLLMFFVFKNSIGMGDIKLFGLIGLYQGLWGAVNTVFFSLLVSFFVSVSLLITRKKSRTDSIAFGPSILLGTIVAIALSGM